MCNLSIGIFNKGIEIGIEKSAIQFIKNLMETMSLTFEQAAKALKVPTEKYEKYKKIIENE